FIAPILMTKKMTADDHLEKSVRSAYGAFGTAWRLLDDLQDIPQDLRAGTKSAVYFCLPEESRSCWEKHCRSEVSGEKGSSKDIVACLRDNNVTAKIQCRICCELDAAATISDACKLTGYADELRCLLKPLITSTRLHETGN
ncbi:MAG: hypothetical protein GY697_23965, partial [Desulfobacterales bacterium]|nr:hypothetical protein [Desulfobacterales bacterium]